MLDEIRMRTACFARAPQRLQAASASIFSSYFKRLSRSAKLAISYNCARGTMGLHPFSRCSIKEAERMLQGLGRSLSLQTLGPRHVSLEGEKDHGHRPHRRRADGRR